MTELFPSHFCLNGRVQSIETLIEKVQDDLADFLREWYNDKHYIVVKTSGSTGQPKQIQLEKAFVAQSAYRTINYFKLNKGSRLLLCLPMQYIAAKLMVVRALLGHLDLHQVSPNSDFQCLQNAENFQLVAMVPNQVAKLLKNTLALTKIEVLLIGGSALPLSLDTALQAVPMACYLGYGMTETATHIALRRINGKQRSEFYECLEGIHVQLSNDCLVINMPLLTSALQTNDLAVLEGESSFKILGRADNMIISGGIKYQPEQLEKRLEAYLNQPFFIASEPDEHLGERIILVIEGEETSQQVKDLSVIFCQVFTRYETPKVVYFQTSLLRTRTGKLIRKISR